MQVGRAIVTAGVVLTLAATIQADVILTLNGLEAGNEFVEVNGKDELVIAVGGNTEVKAGAWRVEASGGVLEERTGGDGYNFSFEDELMPGVVRIVANEVMNIDGVSVKAGETIYELYLIYTPETDIVTGIGLNLEMLKSTEAEAGTGMAPEQQVVAESVPEPEPEVNSEPSEEPAAEVKPATETKPVLPLSEQETEKLSAVRYYPKAPNDLTFEDLVYQGCKTASEQPLFEQYSLRSTMLSAGQSAPLRGYAAAGRDGEIRTINPAGALTTAISKTPTGLREFSAISDASIPQIPLIAQPNSLVLPSSSLMGYTGTESGQGGMETLDVNDPNLIVIPDGTVINTNTIWDCNVYLEGYVYVENAMLVIKPGVTVWLKCHSNAWEILIAGGIIVRNNGVIKAKGVPGPGKLINFYPEYDIAWVGYDFAIWIEETASPLCEISYCNIVSAYAGIVLENNRLERPIQNNQLWWCCWGIVQIGPMLTDVINNLCVETYSIGIETHLSDSNGTASNTTEILIANNTIVGSWYYDWWDYWYYGQGCGIFVSGVEEPEDAGKVTLANNLIASSYVYAIAMVDGWMEVLSICNGYYANWKNVLGGFGGGIPDSDGTPVENFDSYADNEALWEVWKKYNKENGTAAILNMAESPSRDGNSLWYEYNSYYSPHRSEAYADIADLPSQIGTDWSGDANVLSLWFYGNRYNYEPESMYIKLTDGDEGDFNEVENFDSYTLTDDLRVIWKDGYTQEEPVTSMDCFIEATIVRDGYSMMCYFRNYDLEPYYSEVRVTIGTGYGELNITPEWLWMGSLSVRFRGLASNPVTEKMYIKLTDGGTPPRTGKVEYGDMNDIGKEEWQEWDIPLEAFVDDNGVDLLNIKKITIGFGEGGTQGSNGTVYFDDIRLYADEVPEHKKTATVEYGGDVNDVKEETWLRWIIPLEEFTDVNIANVERITIGFAGGEPNSSFDWSKVYFDSIRLCERSEEDPNVPAGDIYPQVLSEDPFEFTYYWYPYSLKQDCNLIDAGYNYIDESTLLGRTTHIELAEPNVLATTPDSNITDIGFHYIAWGYVNAGDGNGPAADLNGDWMVNFEDFAVLADGWRDTYDIDDLSTMADEWLQIAEPNITLEIDGDANDGYVEVGTSGIIGDTQRVFLLIDGERMGEISGFRDGWPFGLDVSKLGGGERQLKLVSVDRNSRVTCMKITNYEFSCPLNYCLLPNHYEPNEPLHFSAFNPSGGNVTVKVYADCGNLVWSHNYGGDKFFDYIPAGITGQHEIDYVNFDKSGVESVRKFTGWKRPATLGDIKALIVIAESYLRSVTIEQTLTVKEAFNKRGVKYQSLEVGDATYNEIKKYVKNNRIKYMYFCAHGDYRAFDANDLPSLRTFVEMPSEPSGCIVSMKKSDFTNPNDAPSWCEKLEPELERANSFYSIGFTDLKFAYFFSCYSGYLRINSMNELIKGQPGQQGLWDIPHSDMSIALGMYEPYISSFFQGWYDRAWTRPPNEPETEYQKWTRLQWERLGEGDNLFDAIMYVIYQQTDFSSGAPVNNYRLRGSWSMWEIVLNGD
jgi:hypothetical protein